MYLGGIWIKAIADIICGVIAIFCSYYAYKKLNWKALEASFAVIICITVMVFGMINITHAINPDIKTVSVEYRSQTGNGVIFGREYTFEDVNGEIYSLTMDPITSHKILTGDEFIDKTDIYKVTYESKSETIIGIEHQ